MVKIEWIENLKKYKYIMIFGARGGACDVYREVKMRQRDIVCFAVSQRWDNPDYLEGKPVKIFAEINSDWKKNGLLLLPGKYKNNERIIEVISQAGFQHIVVSPWQSILSIDNLKNDSCFILGENRKTVGEFVCEEREYEKKDIRVQIYAVTSIGNLHKANSSYTSKYVKYIQAGAALSDNKICDITDNIGDNISKLNPYFCELTAGYWIYKNDKKNKYIGLYQYSRGLAVTDEDIRKIVGKGIDVVLPIPHLFNYELAAITAPQETEVILEAIRRVSPEYIASAKEYYFNKVFIAANIIFAKKEIYCRYYEWLFRILNECIKIKAERNIQLLERIFGYYGEHLLNIFFIHNRTQYNILYSEVVLMF